MAIAAMQPWWMVQHLRTVKRSEEQIEADVELDGAKTLDEQEEDALHDIVALSQDLADIREMQGRSVEICPICGTEWSAYRYQQLQCVVCRALHLRASEAPRKESDV